MTKQSLRFRKALSFLMSALIMLSVFSVGTVLYSSEVSAVSYSEMSALDSYAYSGNDLGATYSKASTTFKVWAPTASKVQIKRYTTGSDSEAGAAVIETKDMTKGSQGVWSVTISGDLNGTYYTYLVTVDGTTRETVDIYARTTGVNGMRGMVLDLDSTDPDGWENDRRVSCPNQTDAVIWEVHVRDFSASADSGMTNKGKYLAFTETGTTVNNDGVHPTGIDYLADLGVTHVHLLPVYDYASVDETKLNTDQFNWGYDPMNYNTPEGSYSTNPYKGEVRVKEFKQMVKALHDKGIGVVMDVVYNHTYSGGSMQNDWFDYTVPGYYYRQNAAGKYSNGSGCGNETASDRAMYHKFMIDSLKYWAEEYHLDGFRFDLMGIHDCDTMNDIRTELDKIDPQLLIYGEPWTAEASPCPKPTAVQGNMKLLSAEIAAFNDKVRDAIKGSCFNASDPGFIQGAGYEEALKGSIQANATSMSGDNKWSKQPSQTVTYTSAHDNYTLYDKLVKSVKGGSGYGNRFDDLVAMNKLAGGIILTSQGMSFFQAGEEFARTKFGDENSYKSPTSTNQLVWSNTKTYADLLSYYKGLIEIRKAYSPFRDPTNTSNGTIYFSWGTSCPAGVVAFTMYNKLNASSEWDYVAVIHNSNSSAKSVSLMTYDDKTLPSQWVIIADGSTAGVTSLGTTGSTINVPARSTMVLVDKTSFDRTIIASGGTVTVNHVLKSGGTTYKTETLKGKEGSPYTTSPLSELLNNGYTVSSVSGETSGTFTKAGTTVTYYYELDSTKYATVTVKYQDAESGQTIAPDTVTTKLIGSSYTAAPISVKGYECDPSLTSNASGTVPAGGVVVVFKYNETHEDTSLKVHYYNSSGWSQVYMYIYTGSGTTATQLSGGWPGSVMNPESSGWYVGSIDYDGTALFIANNNNNGEQDPAGVGSTGYTVSGEVWIKGGKVYPTGKVNVRYTTQDGTVLSKETLKGMADGSTAYTTSAKAFDGYELVTTPTNASGLYTAADITVTYVYKSKAAPEPLVNNASLSPAKIKIGGSAAVACAATGGTKPYQYEVSYKKSTDSSYTTAQSYTSNSTVTLTPASAGTYTVLVKVKDSTGTVKDKTLTLTVEADLPVTLTNQSTVSSQSIKLGSYVTVSCAASGGTTPYQYGVYYKKSTSTSYTTVQAYGTNATVRVTPSAATVYDIRVKVKDAAGTVKAKDFTVSVSNNPTTLTNSTTISATTITLGSSVTVSCAASGGTSPYQYAVLYKKASSDNYTTVQSYGTTKTVKVTPSAATGYNIRTKVKDAAGTVKVKDFTVTVSGAALTNKSTISATQIALGSSVTVTGAAAGGTSPYQYAVFYKKSTSSNYSMVRDYGTTKTIKVTPSAATSYDILVKVKDAKSKIAKKTFTVTVSGAALVNKSTVSSTSVTLGNDVTVTGAASGGTAPYQYAAYYKKASASDYTLLQSYSTAKTITFTPQAAVSYNLRIKVKDKTGTVKTKDYTVKVANAASLVNLTTLETKTVELGDCITVHANAACGAKPYQYAVFYKKASSSSYTTAQSYGTNRTIDITPSAATTYNVRVKVKDTSGAVKTKDFTVKVI